MSTTTILERRIAERDEVRSAAIAMASSDDFNPDDKTYVELRSQAEGLDKSVAELAELLTRQQAADAQDSGFSKAQKRQERESRQPVEQRSWGEQFTASRIFEEWGGRGTSAKLDVEMRALPHTLTSMADALPSSPVYDLTPPPPPPMLIPLTNVIAVSTNAVDFVQWSLRTGAGTGSVAVVPESELKPALEWVPNVTSSSLDTIAGTTSFTRQLAEDAAAVVSFLNGELQREVTRKVEAEAKAALAAATLPTVTGPAGAGVSGAIRAGKAAVQAAGFSPSVAIMSAEDSVDIDIASMSMFRGDPYWGLTPIIDPDLDAGDPVTVIDAKAGVQHYRRNNVQLYLTDSGPGDAFIHNIIWALAEQRAKTVVTRPASGVRVTAGA